MTLYPNNQSLVSVHGGHSGQFCNHAQDPLEALITQYMNLGFEWVGITEHLHPPTNALRYPDEVEANLDQTTLKDQFQRYMTTCRSLQRKYARKIEIFTAFEIETYSGYQSHVNDAVEAYQPDYIVGSVHHVDDLCIDFSPEHYDQAVKAVGGIETLYCRYFDQQLEMIQALSPAVVGHFDLIRIFDDAYPETMKVPEVWDRILRNLQRIKEKGLIMDFNLRALKKGASEPYIARPILEKALEMNIKVVPGDDSHSVQDIGLNMEKGIGILTDIGVDTSTWPKPSLYKWS